MTAEALELEIDTGMHAMETLLTAQMDSAMEKFMAWSYRNAFTVGSRGGVVLVSPPTFASVSTRCGLTSAVLIVPSPACARGA